MPRHSFLLKISSASTTRSFSRFEEMALTVSTTFIFYITRLKAD